MGQEFQPTADNTWSELLRAIGMATASEVLALACPRCDGALRISFYPGDKSITFPTRLQFAAINIDCLSCGAGIRADGCDVDPSWPREVGKRITTTPGSAPSPGLTA